MKQNRLAIIRLLLKLSALDYRRSNAYGEGKGARIIIAVAGIIFWASLTWLGLLMADQVKSYGMTTANGGSYGATPVGYISGVIPFILFADFMLRLSFLHSNTQYAKPFLLLPIPRYACADVFVIKSILQPFNLLWTGLFFAYALTATEPADATAATLIIAISLSAIVLNSLWYTIVHTLITVNITWWILPIIVYAAISIPFFSGQGISLDSFCDFYAFAGSTLTEHYIIMFLGIAVSFATLFAIDRTIAFKAADAELNGNDRNSTTESHRQISFSNVSSEPLVFVKLELASMKRNKNRRKASLYAVLTTVFVSITLTFTSIYSDNNLDQTYMLLYGFQVFPSMLAVNIMGYEGNYIDVLMMRKECILSLLKAKLFISCVMTLLPFLLMMPTVFAGTTDILRLTTFALITAGPVNCAYFQLAVTNDRTIPLVSKITGNKGKHIGTQQIITTIGALFIPLFAVRTMDSAIGQSTTSMALSAFSIIVIATSNLWLRHIYVRMAKRKYSNLENFHATRN